MPPFVLSEPAETLLPALVEALDLVDLGIVLLNRDMRVRFVNRSYAEIWAMPASLLATRPSFRLLLEHVAAQDGYEIPAEELPAWLDQRFAAIRCGTPVASEIDLSDGRRLLHRCIPCADGGRILTFADITPTRQQEALQQAAHAEVERMAVEQRFNTEILESQAAYLASLAENADESARRAEEANRQLEREISERRQLEAQLRRLATTDGLTGTLNRERFMTLGQRELDRSQPLAQRLAVLMLDIDHFKAVNDHYGHLVGDAALKHFVAQLLAGIRGVDLLGRLGGEEFAIVLPAIPAEAAWQVAERLRVRVAATPLLHGDHAIGITVSIGLAMARDTDRTLEQILARADARLYAAKDAGRNRVVHADSPANAPASAYAPASEREPASAYAPASEREPASGCAPASECEPASEREPASEHAA